MNLIFQKPQQRLILCLGFLLFSIYGAMAQQRPYIGYVYPAGGQQGTTFEIRLGGQNLDTLASATVSGSGITAKLIEYRRRLNNQEVQLLNEQVRTLKKSVASGEAAMSTLSDLETPMMSMDSASSGSGKLESATNLITKIEKRVRETVQTPACASIASLAIVEVTIAPDAEPGPREIRLITYRGVSNPLKFHVGQHPEYTRKPMITASIQVLGKESQALRKRPADEIENRVQIPCTLNGQIASGEINRYRFEARKGQQLVISTLGRQLIPFIADAVPGWFQPVITLFDAKGKELAFNDDYQFRPDPTIFFNVPADGEYLLEIHDSLYRGREDFIYRITMGELPFITRIFPLGGPASKPTVTKLRGINVDDAKLTLPLPESKPGTYWLTANRKGTMSNRMPYQISSLPEILEKEPNSVPPVAQKIKLPVIVNGRIEKAGEWDLYQFNGKSNDTVVVEVNARQLDSPLDSIIKLCDSKGALIAFNDDFEDLASGINTHQADSYLIARLPSDETYTVYIGDTSNKGGKEHAYRLRISPPQPDFALRVSPSSVTVRNRANATIDIYAIRKDGFNGAIKLSLKDPPSGFSASSVTLSATQTVTRLTLRSSFLSTKDPVNLTVIGSAKIGNKEIIREAVSTEDRMQAFLWRHLVPVDDLTALAVNPLFDPPPKRRLPVRPSSSTAGMTETQMTPAKIPTNAVSNIAAILGTNVVTSSSSTNQPTAPKFTQQQIAGRLRQLRNLYEEGLLTDVFYLKKVEECENFQ